MPTSVPRLITLHAGPEYTRAIARTLKAAQARGIQVSTPNELAAVALAELALRLGIVLPPRMRPVGTNRYSKPSRG